VDYRHYMATGSSAAKPPVQPDDPSARPPEEPETPERDYTPFAAVGGIAVLGLMLLVGVLIGRGGDSSPPPPPIVVHGGGEEAEASAGAGAGSGAATKPKASAAAKPGGGKGSGFGGGGSAKSEEPVEASDEALESLHSQSGASYEEQSKKLPNKIATPGKAPPIDKTTPPGGGEGGAEVIK
jgi:hypothetical protein